jgi:hypothetical protein
MKIFIKDNKIVWSLPDSHAEDNQENFEIVKVPDSTPLARLNDDGIPIPLSASEVLASLSSLSYADKRVAEYPPASDYLDAVVKGDQAQMQAYIDACLAVKAKYPKPSDQ